MSDIVWVFGTGALVAVIAVVGLYWPIKATEHEPAETEGDDLAELESLEASNRKAMHQ